MGVPTCGGRDLFSHSVMLMLISSHVVDDYYLCELSSTAEHAFVMFAKVHSSLVLKMKRVETSVALNHPARSQLANENTETKASAGSC